MPDDTSDKKVLILDDDEDVVRMLKIVLENEGYDVREFTAPKEALDVLGAGHADLAIVDMDTRKLDLPVFIKKASEFAGLDTPLLLLSPSADEGMAALRGFKGTAEVLPKPISKGDLVDRMRLLLGQRRSSWRIERT